MPETTYYHRWNTDWRQINLTRYTRWQKILEDAPNDWEDVAIAAVAPPQLNLEDAADQPPPPDPNIL